MQKGLANAPGVHEAGVNFPTERATVAFDPARTDAASLVAAIESSGYGARTEETDLQVAGLDMAATDPETRERIAREREYRTLRNKLALAAVAGVLTMLGSMP